MNVHGIIGAVFLVLVMSPVVAGGFLRRFRPRRRKSRRNLPTITDIVLKSGAPSTYDDNMKDYDLLRDAVIAADLAETLATTKGITVFAPNDGAFYRTAMDLGFVGTYDEQEILKFYIESVGIDLIKDILLYHVVPKKIYASLLKRLSKVDTFLELSLNVSRMGKDICLEDKASFEDPKVIKPFDIRAKNGIVHTISRVLVPLAI